MTRNPLCASLFALLAFCALDTTPLHAQLPGAPADNNSIDLGVIKPVLVGVDASGSEKRVPLERGPLGVEGAEIGKAMAVSSLTGGLFGSAAYNFLVPGKASDSVAPAALKEISFPGYSQKQHGNLGTLTLVRLIEDGDKRTLRIKGEKLDSRNTKNASDRVKLEKGDDCWKMLVTQTLEQGHYAVIIFAKGGMPSDYWDFDVK